MTVCTPWADVGDVCAPCNDYEFDTDVLDDWLQIASDALYELTHRRWPGQCTAVVRPCSDHRCRQRSVAGNCGCRRLSQVDLPGYVVSVEAVTIDGAVLDPARYRIDEHRWLVYLPESDSAARQGWPTHQRLDRQPGEADTWTVAYTFGPGPPLGGVKSAAELGCQLALSCHPDPTVAGRCRLPKAVTNVTRQGLTFAKPNPAALFPNGVTGLSTVDLWVQTVNLGSARRPANVFVPGRGPKVRNVG